MELKIVFGYLLLLLSFRSVAQEWPKRVVSLPDKYTLEVPTIDISNSKILDTTVLSITYCFTFQIDPKAPIKSTHTTLDVGKKYVKFSNDDYFRADSMYTYQLKNMFPSYSCKHIPCEEVLINPESSEIIAYNRIQNTPVPLITYTEQIPKIDWQILETNNLQIEGYTCLCAEGIYGGRVWTVWFAPEIPVAYGPWKLSGLPGIILLAMESSGCYRFESSHISSKPKIMQIYACKIKNIEKSAWKKMDAWMHNSPLETMAKDEDTWIYYKQDRLDKTWTIPYNPLELE